MVVVRWKGRRQSTNIQDRRRARVPGGAAVGGGAGVLIVIAVMLLFGGDPGEVLQNLEVPVTPPGGGPTSEAEDELYEYVSVILADTEDRWNAIFSRSGADYVEPPLIVFTGAVQSACGRADASIGPFYCPPDQSVYLDLSFFDDLRRRFGAPGDFAQAYVIAHEVGHHVQNLLGTSDEVRRRQSAVGQEEANQLSVLLELQADCYAGVWGYAASRETNFLERGDLEEALGAAAAIGDDRLQEQSRGYSVPESFTHGTSDQRATWFRRGFESGDPARCDTFSGAN